MGLYLTWQINKGEKLDEDNPVNINVADGEDFWQIDFVDYQVVSYSDDFDQEVLWAVTNDKKLHAIQLKVGDGRLTLLLIQKCLEMTTLMNTIMLHFYLPYQTIRHRSQMRVCFITLYMRIKTVF